MDPNDSDAISNMWTSKLTDVLGALDYIRVSERNMHFCFLLVLFFVFFVVVLFFCFCCRRLFKKILSGTLSECQIVRFQFRIDFLSINHVRLFISCHI